MAPLTKHFLSGAKSKAGKRTSEEEEDEAFDNAKVEVSDVDREDVLDRAYKKVRKIQKDEDLEPEHKLSTIKNIIKKSAEKLKMNMGEFRLLLDDHIHEKPEWVEVTRSICKAVDKRVIVAERRTTRKKIALNNGAKRGDNGNLVGIKLDDIYSVGTRRLARNNNEGTFTVFNLSKNGMDKSGEKTDKAYKFNVYENVLPFLVEGVVILMSTFRISPVEVPYLEDIKKVPADNPDENDPSFMYDFSTLGQITYDDTVGYDLNDEVEIFMRFIFNKWHMTIRKHRTTKSNNPKEKAYFDYDLPAEHMPRLVRSVLFYLRARDLGGCPNLDSPKMAKYKEIPTIKALLEWKVPEPKPEELKEDNDKRGRKRKIDEDEDSTSSSGSDNSNKSNAKGTKKDQGKDDLLVDTDMDGTATDDDDEEEVRAKVKKMTKRKRIVGEANSDDDSDDAEMEPAKKKK